jgi:hypothetical protein
MAVTPASLGLVHCAIGSTHQGFRIAGVVRVNADPDAARGLEGVFADC